MQATMTLNLSVLKKRSLPLIRMVLAEQALADATRLLESQPGFARMAVSLRDEMEVARVQGPPESKYLGTKARAELALKWLDIRAEGLVRFVTNMETQRAFVTVLASAQREAWREFTGGYPEVLQPVSADFCEIFDEISRRARIWARRGYERIAALEEPLGDTAGSAESVGISEELIHQVGGPEIQDRRASVYAFIEAIAECTGRKITRTNFWKVAGYKNRSEFERWQRNDPRTSKSAASNFNRVLRLSPGEFVVLLDKQVQ